MMLKFYFYRFYLVQLQTVVSYYSILPVFAIMILLSLYRVMITNQLPVRNMIES